MRIVQIVKMPDKRQEQIKTATSGFFFKFFSLSLYIVQFCAL